MCSRITSLDEVEDLPFDISQQSAGPDTEEMVVCPFIPELFLHQEEPGQHVLCRTDATRWLESHLDGGARMWRMSHVPKYKYRVLIYLSLYKLFFFQR